MQIFLSACLVIKNYKGNKNSQGMSNSGYITLNMVNTLKVKEYSSYIAIQAWSIMEIMGSHLCQKYQ